MRDKEGKTVFHYISRLPANISHQFVKSLIGKRPDFDVNFVDDFGNTGLHIFVQKYNLKLDDKVLMTFSFKEVWLFDKVSSFSFVYWDEF